MNSLRYICSMAYLRRVFEFYINSSIHVALAVCAFTGISSQVLHTSTSIELLCFIFFGTITGYNFVKYAGIAKLHHYSLTNSLRAIQIFSLFCAIICVFFAFRISIKTLLACIPLGLLTLFYAVPIAPKQNNLRTLPTLKIFVIAAVWAATTVYLPEIDSGHSLNGRMWMLITERFLLVLVLILPFEIRDVAFDDIELGTFPQMVGVKWTKILGYILLLIYLGLVFFGQQPNFEEKFVKSLLALLTAFALLLAKVSQGPYFSSFWVEGIPIICWALYWFI